VFGVVLSVVLPVVLTVTVGFLWSRFGNALNSRDLTALVSEIATPCLIISTFQSSRLSFEAFSAMAAGTATAILAFTTLGGLILWAAGLRVRTFLPSVAFPNAGNLGLPVALYAFGEEGLGYAIAFFSIASVANYTLGQGIAAGRANWRGLARLPVVYAVAIGIALAFWNLRLPGWLATTVSLIGSLTVPIMLLMLGVSLGQLRITEFGRAFFVAFVRLGVGVGVGFGVAAAFGLGGTLKSVLILQAANPVAVYNYLFAQRWNNEPEAVAGVVVISTLLALLTIPLLLTWLLSP
jgi:predicted permease